jgi:hypothetical protein
MNYDEDISSFMPLDGQSKKYSEVFSDSARLWRRVIQPAWYAIYKYA